MKVLFCAPAGARRGFGHLLRCRSLARALAVRPLVQLRGPRASHDVALALGCDVATATPERLIPAMAPDVVIVDDPIPTRAARLMAIARTANALVVGIHDLGIGHLGADVLIDGSIVETPVVRRRGGLTGPAFAVLDPALVDLQAGVRRRDGVLISLGGGPRAHSACAIAAEIGRAAPDVRVRVVGGFVSGEPPAVWRRCPANVQWVGASANLPAELASAEIAVVGGGMSLYEACALGAAAVAVPVVNGQRPTVAGFVARGAALGQPRDAMRPRRIAADALRLLHERDLRQRLIRTARRLVDGHGASRVARAIRQRVEGR